MVAASTPVADQAINAALTANPAIPVGVAPTFAQVGNSLLRTLAIALSLSQGTTVIEVGRAFVELMATAQQAQLVGAGISTTL